ncbi:MAG: hypothetical protein SFZ24_09500 [Planctomycetota bacterium]|nr:hypothetical protein [Planctomycetota bacterium]
MLHRMLNAAAVAAIVISLPAAALAQEDVVIKPGFRAGQSVTYTLALGMQSSQKADPEAEPVTSQASAVAKVELKVKEVGADGGLLIDGVIKEAQLEVPLEGGAVSGFDWRQGMTVAETAPEMTKLGPVLGTLKLDIAVSADGTVKVRDSFGPYVEAVNALPSPDERMLGFFTDAGFAAMLEPIFKLDGAGDAPRAVGKGWQRTETVGLPPAAAVEILSEFSVTAVNSDVVDYFGNLYMTVRRPAEAGEDVPTVELVRGGGGTGVKYDRQRGLLLSRKNSYNLTTLWTLGETKIEQNQFTMQKINIEE